MLFTKRPVQIEAFRWTGGPDQEEDPVWIVDAIKAGTVSVSRGIAAEKQKSGIAYPPALYINTPEGTMVAHPGDWIIKGVAGEIYPCKPDIFSQTYRASTPVQYERPAGDIVTALRECNTHDEDALSVMSEAARVLERMRDALREIDTGVGYPGMRSLLTVLTQEMMQQIAHEALGSYSQGS